MTFRYAQEHQTPPHDPPREYNGCAQLNDEAILSAVMDLLVTKGGRPVSALMSTGSLTWMAHSFGYNHSERVKWHDGMLEFWIPSGWLQIRPDPTLDHAAILFDSEHRPICRVRLGS